MEHKLKAYATEFRNSIGYNSSEPIDMNALLQQLDIIAVFKKCDDFSGLCIKEGNDKFILINSSHSLGRQNFTIAHEIYHLFYDKEFETHQCHIDYSQTKSRNEKWADIFASHLLIPEDGILRLIPDYEDKKDKLSLSTLLKIEQTYKCSRKALLKKLEMLKLLSKSAVEKFSENIISNALLYGYTSELYSPSKERALLGAYGSLANKLYQDEKISEGHYTELMKAIGINIDEIVEDDGQHI